MEILIFENSKQIAERLVNLISESVRDTTFYRASSYAEAVYFFQECSPDTVLVDMKYPDNNGVELLKTIKSGNCDTVVIALTSDADDLNRKQWKDYGIDFIFDKYADFERIPGIINGIAEARHTEN